MADKTEVEAARDQMLVGQLLHTTGHLHVIVPDGYDLRDLENTQPSPSRSKGDVVLHDVGSFVRFYNEMKGTGITARIYGSVKPPKFTGVLNDDATHQAGWGDYRVIYACPYSPEWKTWTGNDGVKLSQTAFAEFIENNLPDIVEGALLLEVATTLEAKKKVNFASGIRLSDGQTQFTYEEEIAGTASKGQLKVPETFQLGLSVFENGTPYAVTARLRYRIAEGKLTLWYDLLRPQKIVEDAVNAVWTDIEAGTTASIYHGLPAD